LAKINKTIINNKIKADEVLFINEKGEKEGLITKKEALDRAEALSLDLVQVSSLDSNPVVCKIMDFGKYSFTKKKNASNTRTKSRKTSLKEIKFRPTTDTGDYNIKLKKIKGFILSGDKTKISIRFRGREILNSDMGLEILNKIRLELETISKVDQEPSLEGRQLQMVLSPLKSRN
tara:strand:- start:30 stop:557 length:528 start_codon:yes stop_codon:yes gene_type:complete